MDKLVIVILLFAFFSCSSPESEKIRCYAWTGGPGKMTDKELKEKFIDLKQKGLDGLMYNGGHDAAVYHRVGKIAKEAGLEFHAWIPTMVQAAQPELKPEWYAVNGKGESAYDKPAYVNYYKFLCPNRPEVWKYLDGMYGLVADVAEVDGIHLDYIRFPDVILARGLWNKYNLVMDREYPQFDYCYCDKCAADFKAKTDINIREVEDPSQVEEWKQFRYDLITSLVNHLADGIHARNKKITAAVFPGPNSVAKKIVRQEWDKWNLDAFLPMNYNDFYLEDTKWIGEVCRESVTALDNRKPVYSGLFICPDPSKKTTEKDPEGHGLLPGELEDADHQPVVLLAVDLHMQGLAGLQVGKMVPDALADRDGALVARLQPAPADQDRRDQLAVRRRGQDGQIVGRAAVREEHLGAGVGPALHGCHARDLQRGLAHGVQPVRAGEVQGDIGGEVIADAVDVIMQGDAHIEDRDEDRPGHGQGEERQRQAAGAAEGVAQRDDQRPRQMDAAPGQRVLQPQLEAAHAAGLMLIGRIGQRGLLLARQVAAQRAHDRDA